MSLPPPVSADAGDVPAHTIGLGYDEAAIAAVEAAEEAAAADLRCSETDD